MIIAGLLFAGLAGLIHVHIFCLESIAWTADRTRAIFGTTAEEAAITRPLAFNQGFYNLFLAILVLLGIIFFVSGLPVIGATLVFAGAGSMVAAGLVLLISSPDKAAAALLQLLPPLLAVVLVAIGMPF